MIEENKEYFKKILADLNIIRSKINGVFLSYYLNNVKKNEIAQMAQGIAVVHLYPNQLRNLIIQFPKPKEQQKIASSLTSLETLITAQAEKIEQLKVHKKGVMQRLFPKND
jgi:type I restriction enzyme S subunit